MPASQSKSCCSLSLSLISIYPSIARRREHSESLLFSTAATFLFRSHANCLFWGERNCSRVVVNKHVIFFSAASETWQVSCLHTFYIPGRTRARAQRRSMSCLFYCVKMLLVVRRTSFSFLRHLSHLCSRFFSRPTIAHVILTGAGKKASTTVALSTRIKYSSSGGPTSKY